MGAWKGIPVFLGIGTYAAVSSALRAPELGLLLLRSRGERTEAIAISIIGRE